MAQAASTYLGEQRRRSTRIEQIVPIVVCGIDLLGQPFEERTATQVISFHGCRYASKHHLPKNTWVTLEIPAGRAEREAVRVRARVRWIHRPRALRELFQVGVEIETAGNIWGVKLAPEDWKTMASSADPLSSASEKPLSDSQGVSAAGQETQKVLLDAHLERLFEETSRHFARLPEAQAAGAPLRDTPVLDQLQSDFDTHTLEVLDQVRSVAERVAREHVVHFEEQQRTSEEEFYRRWWEEFQRENTNLKEQLSAALTRQLQAEMTRTRQEVHGNLKNEWEEDLSKQLMALRRELEASGKCQEASERHPDPQASGAPVALRENLEAEMELTRSQWIELLESSLDSAAQRLTRRLTDSSQQMVQSSERKLAERVAALLEESSKSAEEAHAALGEVRAALGSEMTRAKATLSEFESAATLFSEHCLQLEGASRNSLHEFRRQLETSLSEQTVEMGRRTTEQMQQLIERAGLQLEQLGRQTVSQTSASAEERIAPALERAALAAQELEARGGQVEETLRIHRERLRQVSEQLQRESGAQMTATLQNLQNSFEETGKQAFASWAAEVDAARIRASGETSESLAKATERQLEEARARLEAQTRDSLERVQERSEQTYEETSSKLAERLDHLGRFEEEQTRERLNAAVQERVLLASDEFSRTAQAVIADSSQRMHLTGEEARRNFVHETDVRAEEGRSRLISAGEEMLRNLHEQAQDGYAHFQAQVASTMDQGQKEAQEGLHAKLHTVLEALQARGEAQFAEWSARQAALSAEVVAELEERLRSLTATWAETTMQQLHALGQNRVDALVRGAEEDVRRACVGLFDGMAQAMKEKLLGVPTQSRSFPSSEIPAAGNLEKRASA